MEIKETRIIELFLALILIALLLAVSLNTINKDIHSQETISNSYNVNSYNTYTQKEPAIKTIPNTEIIYLNEKNYPYKDDYKKATSKDYLDCYDYEKERDSNYREYSGQNRREDFLGTSVQEYYVYVLNKERTGRYFTVEFKLEDKNGYEDIESVTQYIRAGEKEKFSYKDIQFERNEIVDWSYKVIPEDY
jgi:hypothetical protein